MAIWHSGCGACGCGDPVLHVTYRGAHKDSVRRGTGGRQRQAIAECPSVYRLREATVYMSSTGALFLEVVC